MNDSETGARVSAVACERVVGLVEMLRADPSRTWQEVLLSGDVDVSGIEFVGTLLRGRTVSLALRDGDGFLHLITTNDNIALGCPIASIYTRGVGRYWHDDSATSVSTEALERELGAAIDRIDSLLGENQVATRLLVRGNANFAHVALSVVSAMERAIAQAAREGRVLHAADLGERHPLGNPKDLYPELRSVESVAALSEDIGAGLRVSQEVIVPAALGVANKKPLMKIGEAVRRRLSEFVPPNAAQPRLLPAVQAGEHDLVVWMSLRGLWRRSLPLMETVDLAETLARLMQERAERPAVVLDGISVQFGDLPVTDVSGFSVQRHMELEGFMADTIGERIAEIAPRCTTYRAVGLPLWESFRLAAEVDAYLTHDGTTQHKIGWLRPELPGIVHGPRQRNVGQGFIWHPVDSGTPAIYFPRDLMVDHKEGPIEVPHANYGYSLVRGDRLDEFVAAFIDGIRLNDPNRVLYERFYSR